MALREANPALYWAVTRPEDNTPTTALAVSPLRSSRLGLATVMGRIVAI